MSAHVTLAIGGVCLVLGLIVVCMKPKRHLWGYQLVAVLLFFSWILFWFVVTPALTQEQNGGFISSALAQEPGVSMRVDWTVNVASIVAIAIAFFGFVIMAYQTKWRTDKLDEGAKALGLALEASDEKHGLQLEKIGIEVNSLTRSVALQSQHIGAFDETMKSVGSAMTMIARQDERLLTVERENKEMRSKIDRLANGLARK